MVTLHTLLTLGDQELELLDQIHETPGESCSWYIEEAIKLKEFSDALLLRRDDLRIEVEDGMHALEEKELIWFNGDGYHLTRYGHLLFRDIDGLLLG